MSEDSHWQGEVLDHRANLVACGSGNYSGSASALRSWPVLELDSATTLGSGVGARVLRVPTRLCEFAQG